MDRTLLKKKLLKDIGEINFLKYYNEKVED